MPRVPGSGRRPGSPNKANATFRERLAQLKCDPVLLQVMICNGDLKCGVCHGTGKTKFQPARGLEKLAERTCQSCYGSGKERLSPRERREAASDLMDRCYPRLKAVEMSGSLSISMAQVIREARAQRLAQLAVQPG